MYTILSREMWKILFMIAVVRAAKHPSHMCVTEQTQDCSFQLPEAQNNSCQVYNTSVCLSQFSNVLNSDAKSVSEMDSKFLVSIYPYSAVLLDLQSGIPISAINITLTVLHPGIKYFIITIKQNAMNKTMCRIIDFHRYSEEISVPTTFFYDCFKYLEENNIQNVSMSFKAMPMNEELNYYVYIPPAQTIYNSYRWKPVIMIVCDGFTKGSVALKFSQAPFTMKISSYSVHLMQAISNKVVESKEVESSLDSKMIYVEFSSVETGAYYIIITPMLLNGTKYFSSKTAVFEVEVHSLDMMILYICMAILFGLSLFPIVMCLRSFFYPDFPPKRVLLVYSYNPDHKDFVSSFTTYLSKVCNLIVITIHGITGDPQQWIRDRYKEADAIVFIISEDLFFALDGHDCSYPKYTTHWPMQVPDTQAYISHQIFNNDRSSRKKICKVIFPYASEKFVPDCLGDDMGKCYKLPKEFNKFLCFIFNSKPLIPFLNIYPKLQGCCPESSSCGQYMLEKMNQIQKSRL